jgi:ABC-type transport system involved in cytochrome bd biosynthesis fused ATPase/permease subunit
VTLTPSSTTGSNQLGLEIARAWRPIAVLSLLHFGALIAVPLALLSVGAEWLFVLPLVGGAAVEALRLWMRQRVRSALRQRCLAEAARAALDKTVPIPEASVDSAFWAAHMIEYAVAVDAPAILGASLAGGTVLVVSWLRLGTDIVLWVLVLLALGCAILMYGNRSRTRAVDAIVECREATAAFISAAERDFGEIHGPSARQPYLDELRRQAIRWCEAEARLERRQFFHRLALSSTVLSGFALLALAQGLDPLQLSLGTSFTLGRISELLLLCTILPIGSVLATHVESLLLARAALEKTHRFDARPEARGRSLPNHRPRHLSAKRLRFRYEDHLALDIDALELDLSQPCLLMGPNGAGKTTFGALLTGVFLPTEGTLEIDGVPCGEIDRDALAFVPQNPLILDTLSIETNIRLVAPNARAEDMRAALLRLGLDRPLDAPAGQLSKGEQRRIAFVRALLKEPALLVLDEPDAWLDETGRRVLLEIVREEGEKRAVVLISHRAEFATHGLRTVTLTPRHQLADSAVSAPRLSERDASLAG